MHDVDYRETMTAAAAMTVSAIMRLSSPIPLQIPTPLPFSSSPERNDDVDILSPLPRQFRYLWETGDLGSLVAHKKGLTGFGQLLVAGRHNPHNKVAAPTNTTTSLHSLPDLHRN